MGSEHIWQLQPGHARAAVGRGRLPAAAWLVALSDERAGVKGTRSASAQRNSSACGREFHQLSAPSLKACDSPELFYPRASLSPYR